MSIVSEKLGPSSTEEEVRDFIRTDEAAYGEIARIGNEDGFTMGSFYYLDPAHPRPEVEAAIKVAAANSPEEEGELCRGDVYIKGDLVHIIVYRPSA